MATQKEIDASTQAEALLNSDVFKDAVKNLTAEYIAKWINSDVEKDQDLREAIYQAINYSRSRKTSKNYCRKRKIAKTQFNRIRSFK